MKNTLLFLFYLFIFRSAVAGFTISPQKTMTYSFDCAEVSVVQTAVSLFSHDFQSVFSYKLPFVDTQRGILIGTAGKSRVVAEFVNEQHLLQGRKQAFMIKVLPGGSLLVMGSDPHGTAYGVMELSRLIGVSPWEWWADVTPARKETFQLPQDYCDIQSPSVEYRGIFINDEDWGLMPWSGLQYEPSDLKGHIGPETHRRIFELLLRLRANTFWPAMHECTLPFFLTPGNRDMARDFGINIGTSHCEPMACNAAGEWNRRGDGEYNYLTNREGVRNFWEERVKEVASQEILYTLGMRGVHDGKMQGAKTVAEQKGVLEQVFLDQRAMLANYVSTAVDRVPQVFIPYKEVLDIYHAGLAVPDDVTLMWCDDNYGYIRHFPTEQERARSGGNGIYYHISYWGRPHDYLWLGTFNPGLLFQQMNEAYDRGIRKMWILNVGDIKPSEYQIELFMDLAWDNAGVRNEGVTSHLTTFLQREFGESSGQSLLPVMQQHYRLSYICKPEFLGNTRVEEASPEYKIVKDMPWSQEYIAKRLAEYAALSRQSQQLALQMPPNRKDAFFQLIAYPVQAAEAMNRKMLYAQLARQGKTGWQASDDAYREIVALTDQYDKGFTNEGKWMGFMDYRPRKLPVFEPVNQSAKHTVSIENTGYHLKRNGTDLVKTPESHCEMLGYEYAAVKLAKEEPVSFEFDSFAADTLTLELRILPTHAVDGGAIRMEITVNEQAPRVISFETKGRSEEWKQNVLRNQAIKTLSFQLGNELKQRILLRPLDEGVVLDQLFIR